MSGGRVPNVVNFFARSARKKERSAPNEASEKNDFLHGFYFLECIKLWDYSAENI